MGGCHGGPFQSCFAVVGCVNTEHVRPGLWSEFANEAVMMEWDSLHGAMQVLGIRSKEGLAEWVHAQGFPTTMGSSFQRAQECLLNEAAAHDTRVTGLESAYVQVILQACEHGITEDAHQIPHRRPIASTSKMFSRSGSEFCKVVLTRSRGVSAMLPEWHCKNGTMLLSQAIIIGRSVRGKRSRCFLLVVAAPSGPTKRGEG